MTFDTDFFENISIAQVKKLWGNRPSWLAENKDHKIIEHAFLAGVINHFKCKTLCEVGVSSGFTSVVLLNAAKQSHDTPTLYGIDFAEKVHCIGSKNIGAALTESFSEYSKYYKLHTSSTSIDAPALIKEPLDFAFIDGNHFHPWAALDLINLLPLMKDKGIVCLHDVRLPRGWQQAGVYLYECFEQPKVLGFDKGNNVETNVGMIALDADMEKNVASIVKSLGLQWQTLPDSTTIEKTVANIKKYYPEDLGNLLINALESATVQYKQYKDILEEASTRQEKHYWKLSKSSAVLTQFMQMGPLKSVMFFFRSIPKYISYKLS